MAIIDKIQLSGTVYTIGQETTTAVTSASTDNEIPTAKAVYDAIPTGGSASYSAGRGIDITNDTISCTLPITLTKQKTTIYGDNDNLTIFNLKSTNEINHTGTTDNIIIGHNNKIGSAFDPSKYNFIYGDYNNLNQGFGGSNSSYNFIVGDYNTIGKNYSENASHTALFGTYLTPKNSYEYAFGKYNNSVSGSSTFGDSGNTLFSVGNGTADNARHNAFEIRQNGDIYLNDGSKLQDTVSATTANTTALGGLKLVKLTQSEYDALTTKDASTIYFIVN